MGIAEAFGDLFSERIYLTHFLSSPNEKEFAVAVNSVSKGSYWSAAKQNAKNKKTKVWNFTVDVNKFNI